MLIWPGDEPRAVGHLSTAGTLVVAGEAAGGPAIASHLHASGWRVLLGDADLADEIVAQVSGGLLRRRTRAREQRLMLTRAPAPLPAPEGFRPAVPRDLPVVSEFACRLHVEDRMGPPLAKGARDGVTERMRESIARGATWVAGAPEIVAKFDVSLCSERRGAQIAGVYVHQAARGRGIAAGGVAAVSRELLEAGIPGVTLHVRADNPAGRAAYARAGFVDRGAWTLALR